MKKNTKQKISARGPIARKIIKTLKMREKNKIINLQDVKDVKHSTEELINSFVTDEQLLKHDKIVAAYIKAQNHLSILIELFCEHVALKNLIRRNIKADEIYMPSYPPMSPVTDSHFFCWSAFDLMSGGKASESLCTVITDYCNSINFDEMLCSLFDIFQQSYVGIYVQEDYDEYEEFVFLRELVTNKLIKARVASKYTGAKGELWYARVLPPFSSQYDYSVIFGTPYILKEANPEFYENEWMAFFQRQLDLKNNINQDESYYRLMKFGLNHHYWMEYITLAYVGFDNKAIFLRGIPDVAESLPLSHLAQW